MSNMSKFYLHTPTESSARPLKALKKRLQEERMMSMTTELEHHYQIIPGDRRQALTKAECIATDNTDREIIHLWAGENSSGTEDEKYRAAITCLSDYQLCTNEAAKKNAENILRAAGREPNAYVVGNIMKDDLETDDSYVPENKYDLVFLNPETGEDVDNWELCFRALEYLDPSRRNYFWISPNDDPGSEVISSFTTHSRLQRKYFLGLIDNCNKFITNSSCAFYEAQFLMDREDIVMVGERNAERVSADSKMNHEGAIDRTIQVLNEIANE